MKLSARREARLVDISTFTTGDDRIRALTTAPRIKPTSIFLRSARRPNPGRRSTYRRGIIVQTTGTGSVLCVYREVQVLKKTAAKAKKTSNKPRKPVAIVSYDEKPGIQAIATTSPDLPPVPGTYATFSRDHEYKRHGTLSLLAGIDLLTGKVHALVKDRHRSREFIEFLKLLNAAYPAGTAIKLILDNHSAHISRETQAWLATQPAGRFDFTFTPKHGSWLNLIEGFFSKFARSVLRHIRVASKQEPKGTHHARHQGR